MKPDNANVFNPSRSNPDQQHTGKPKKGRSSVGQAIKTVVLFPFMLIAAAIFGRNLGR